MSEVNIQVLFSEPSADLQLKATLVTVPNELVIYNEELRQFVENVKNEVSASVEQITQNLSVDVTGRLGYRFTVNTQAGTSYTPVLADEGTLIRMTASTENQFVVPGDATVAFEVGTILNVRQVGTGVTSIVAAEGVTVNTPDATMQVDNMHLGVGLVKVGPNEWDLVKSFVGVPLGEVEAFVDDVEAALGSVETVQTNLSGQVSELQSSLDAALVDFEQRLAAAVQAAEDAVAGLGDVAQLSDFGALKEEQGYQKLPGGLIYQWGKVRIENTKSLDVAFPIPFPTDVLNVTLGNTWDGIDTVQEQEAYLREEPTNSTLRLISRRTGDGAGHGSTITVYWQAIGY